MVDEFIQMALAESNATSAGSVGVDSGQIEIGDCGIVQISIPAVGGDGVYPVWDLGDYIIIEKNMLKIMEMNQLASVDWFWSIIEKVKAAEYPEVALKVELKDLSLSELVEFQQHFDTFHKDAYVWNLWGAARIINEYCSDDGFDYFRRALISLGRSVYENALKDPESLVKIELTGIVSNESFGYVAGEVYEEKTGEEIPHKSINSTVGPLAMDWDINDDSEGAIRFPRLCKKYRNK